MDPVVQLRISQILAFYYLNSVLIHFMAQHKSRESTRGIVDCIQSAIGTLVLVEEVMIRYGGKAYLRPAIDSSFDPEEYDELRRHLECIILLRPSRAGLPEQLDPSHLTTVQKRLINANLLRRHRTVVAQRHTRKPPQVATSQDTLAARDNNMRSRPSGQGDVLTSFNTHDANLEQKEEETGKPTAAGSGAALTADGSEGYTSDNVDTRAEFPLPPPHAIGALFGKCPCCCQSISTDEMFNPTKWR